MSVQLLGKRELKRLASVANDGAGTGYNGFAKGMMAKMGWEEGQGLGKDKQGRATYVQVKKKEDNAGLGKEKAQQNNVNDQWYFDAFDSALANMGGKKKKKKDKKSKKKAGSDKSSDGDDSMYNKMFKATGGARMGMRARASQNGKLARTEGGHDGAGDNGIGNAHSTEAAVKDEKKEIVCPIGAAGGALEESSSRKRRRLVGADVGVEHSSRDGGLKGVKGVKVKKEKTSGDKGVEGVEVKKEKTSGDKKVAGEGGGEGGGEVEATSKAERRRLKSEAKKAKRANKAAKEEESVEGGADSNSETQESVLIRGGGGAEAEGKARKKKNKRAEK
eukprot:jgi/Undpi1/1170/HiC_scaffold_10.g04632.m1